MNDSSERRRWRLLAELPLLVLAALVVAFIIKTFLAQAFSIPSASMEPQLREGDRVVVSKTAYRLHDPNRGDVIVFDKPGTEEGGDDGALPARVGRELLEGVGLMKPDEEELIKRVIGLPGEVIEGRNGHVYVNGRELVEPYLAKSLTTDNFGPLTVPDDHLFVMGDNRNRSQDSRWFGPVPRSLVVGRAIARIWPPGRVAFL